MVVIPDKVHSKSVDSTTHFAFNLCQSMINRLRVELIIIRLKFWEFEVPLSCFHGLSTAINLSLLIIAQRADAREAGGVPVVANTNYV